MGEKLDEELDGEVEEWEVDEYPGQLHEVPLGNTRVTVQAKQLVVKPAKNASQQAASEPRTEHAKP